MKIFIDTNVFLRYLTNDNAMQSPKALTVMEKLLTGEMEATTCEAIIAEICFVLASKKHYGLSHSEISKMVSSLLAFPGIKIPRKDIYLTALELFGTHADLDIEDCILAAWAEDETDMYDEKNIILSFDTDYDQLPTITRNEP